MDSTFLGTHIKKIIVQRNIFLFLSTLLCGAVVLLSILAFTKKERIVIVPTTGPSFWIEDGRVSTVYLEKMGLFLSDLLLNRNPSDVDRKNQMILEQAHPIFYHEIRRQLLQDRENILQNDQSFFFRSEKSYVDATKNCFFIEGEFLVMIGKNGQTPSCAQQEHKKYTLGFQCQNSKLLLTSLKREDL